MPCGNNNRHQVMNFVGRYGPVAAPICFLTIEDGGGIWGANEENLENFVAYFQGNPVWEPINRHRVPLGRPGEIISKIMAAIFPDRINNWQLYRDTRLYTRNECNIKYYPIPRRTTDYWHEVFTNAIGLNLNEYIDTCHIRRPEIINNAYPQAFNGNQLHIICGARPQWLDFLNNYTYNGLDLERTAWLANQRGQLTYEIYTNNNRAVFCYFKIFQIGLTNNDIQQFGAALRPLINPDIVDRVL